MGKLDEQRRANLKMLINEIQSIIDEFGGGVAANSGSTSQNSDGTAYVKVVRFLESVGNKPQTTAAIREATGLSRGAVSELLYSSRASDFQSIDSPGHTRKKLWCLKRRESDLSANGRKSNDLVGKTSVEACRQILLDHKNRPLHVLTMAREAIRRGYKGRAKTTGDALEFTTATGFWARLSRDHANEFEQVSDKTFKLRNPDDVDRAGLF